MKPRSKRFLDKQGGTHDLVVGDNLCWARCRQHNNPLSDALAGLPGALVPCRTGLGWQDTGVLVKIGWPIWVARSGYMSVAGDPHAPVDVLRHILGFPAFLGRVIGNSAMTEELFDLALEKASDPTLKDAINAFRSHRQINLFDEHANLSQVNAALLAEDVKTLDLQQVPKQVLGRMLQYPRVSRELAGNLTCPIWLMERLMQQAEILGFDKEVAAEALLDNPATPTGILGEFLAVLLADDPRSGSRLAKIANHPQVSGDQLVRICLGENRIGREEAESRLAELSAGVTAVELEVAGVELGL